MIPSKETVLPFIANAILGQTSQSPDKIESTSNKMADRGVSKNTKAMFIALGFILILLIVLVIICYLICKNRKKKKQNYFVPSGLSNRSEVCYLNSMIQATASSYGFISQLEILWNLCSNCQSLNSLLELLSGVNEFGNKEEIIRRNTELMNKLIKSINWERDSQQDAYELLATVINSIEKNLKIFITTAFQMPLKLKLVHRRNEKQFADKIQDHLGLSIGLCGEYYHPPGESIEYLIEQHFSPTIIDDDPKKTMQMFFYQQAPDVLLLHIQANKWDNERKEMIKPTYFIKYGKELIMMVDIVTEPGVEETRKETVYYNLKAIVNHMGNISGGHYVTYRKYHDSWFLLNDEQVEETEFNNKIVPYLMVYEKSN